MKKNILMCLGILFCSTLIFAKEYKITENPEEVIRPSILRLTDDGYRLIWNYNKKAKVTFGKVGGKTQKIVPVENTINGKKFGYYVDFTDLEADEKYFYQVKGEKKVYFTAPKSKDAEFTFVGMADHQTFADATERGFVKIASENPDFIVSAGDMLENGKLKNWQENFFQKMPILQGFPFAACEGNNDAGLNLFQSFLALDNRYYSFTYGNTRFVVLDSNLTFNEGSEQIEWLENTLKENNSLWTIVVFHIGPYVSTLPDYSQKKFRETVVPVMEKYNVDLVINGHNHFYDRTTKINGITYVTLPCVSARLSHVSANENSGYYAKTITGKYGYGLFTVSDKEIKVIVKDIQNKMLDEFVIGK